MKILNSVLIVSLGMIMNLTSYADAVNRSLPDQKQYVNSLGIKLLRIEPGSFMMGNDKEIPEHLAAPNADLKHGDYDEQPVHKVTISKGFYISETEVTIEQYRKFKHDYPGFSDKLDNDPFATGISWYDAMEFCKWLSKKEGLPYRLPTESEWEYVCRAGSEGHFCSGENLPKQGTANSWGVRNMHSWPAEWCYDWHGLYPDRDRVDPVGPESGLTKVVRGGSPEYPETPRRKISGQMPYYLRSANRASIAPAFSPPPREYQIKQAAGSDPSLGEGKVYKRRSMGKWKVPGWHCIGFRVVLGSMPETKPYRAAMPFFAQCVKQTTAGINHGPDMNKPYYRTRRILPGITAKQMIDVGWKVGMEPGTGTNYHNGALLALDNGDLLACYYNGYVESHPDLSICLIRLRAGARQWDKVSVFPDFLDINDASPFIFTDNGVIWLGWGSPQLGGGYPFHWTTSKDNGQTWIQIQFPIFEGHPGGYRRKQPINAAFRAPDGVLYIAYDGSRGTSGLWATANNGKTWYAPNGRVKGLHATFVLLDDNSILSYGTRNTGIDGFCPKNVSRDFGQSWQVSRSPMPVQGGGQNPIMLKLKSGRLLYVSNMNQAKDPALTGFTKPGAYACLSEDGGDTWKIRRLVGGQTKDKDGKSVSFRTVGYVGAQQTANGLIHLVTSRNQPDLHVELNEAWILANDEDAQKAANTDYSPVENKTIKQYKESYSDGKLKAKWSAGVNPEGVYLLHGEQSFYYPDGQLQWQVTFTNGLKTGLESYYRHDRSIEWQRKHNDDGSSELTIFDDNGKKKAVSTWKDKKLLSYQIQNTQQPKQEQALISENMPPGQISLFDGKDLGQWKITDFGGQGKVYTRDESIILEIGNNLTGVTWSGPVLRTNYEINFDAMRLDGEDFFCALTFPVDDSYVTFIVGGWAGNVCGLSSIDYFDASDNEATVKKSFDNNRWYHIRVRVEPGRIQCWIDKKQYVDLETEGKKLSTRTEVEESKPLGISCWQTAAAIKNISFTKLADTQKI